MQSSNKERSRTIEINSNQGLITSILFAEHGKEVLSGGIDNGGTVRRWRVDDGHEVGEPIRTQGSIYAVALSPDGKWLVCGTSSNHPTVLTVWDIRTHEKVLDIKGHTNSVCSVDISPNSTKLVTGALDKSAFIFSLKSGEKLVGPLPHPHYVITARFSPNGDRIATVSYYLNEETKSIRVYNSDDGQLLLEMSSIVYNYFSSPLAWSTDGCQLFVASKGEVKLFDATSGPSLSQWSVPGGKSPMSIALSCNQRFAVVATEKTASFWDTSTRTQIGPTIRHASAIYSLALSPDYDCVAIGEDKGKVTLRSLRDLIPSSYLEPKASNSTPSLPFSSQHQLQLPFMLVGSAVLESWTKGDLARAEELLTQEVADHSVRARALAQRALIRSRLKQWDAAIKDAKKSIEIQQSAIGYVALSIAFSGNGEHEFAWDAFDFAFSTSDGLSSENNLLLLIKTIMLFECGKHENAIARVDRLIDIVDDKSLYVTVRTYMFVLLARALLDKGNYQRATELLKRAQDAVPFQPCSRLELISLIFGWDFDNLKRRNDQEQEETASGWWR